MKINFFFLFGIISTYFIHTNCSLQLDLSSSVIESNRQWTRVKLAVTGGKKPYKLYYDEYPQGWNQVNQFIYAPAKLIEPKMKYPCKVRVFDKDGIDLSATVIFYSQNYKLSIAKQSYPYDKQFNQSFFTSQGYSGKPQLQQNKINMRLSRSPQTIHTSKVNIQDQLLIQQIKNITKSPGSGTKQLSKFLSEMFKSTREEFENQFKNMRQNKVYEFNERRNQRISPWADQFKYNQKKNSNIQSQFALDKYFINWQNKVNNQNDHEVKPIINSIESKYQQNINPTIVSNPTISKTISSGNLRPQNAIQKFQATQKQIKPSAISSIKSIQTQKNYDTSNSISIRSVQKQQKSIEAIFSKLPSSLQLDSIILSADTYAILKVVQATVRSDLKCEQKYSYLSEFLGRILSAIEMKTYAVSQLDVIIESARTEIIRLNQEIQYSQSEKKKLQIDSLKNQIKTQLSALESLYNQFNTVQSIIETQSAKIVGYGLNLQILRTKASDRRSDIQLEKLKLTQIDSDISIIQRNLRQAKSRKKISENNIEGFQRQLTQVDKNITNSLSKIEELQKQVDNLETLSDQLKLTYTTLEIKVSRLNNDIEKAEEKQDQINSRISTLTDRLNLEKRKLVVDELNQLKTMIDNLKNRLPSIEQQVDLIYYSCNNLLNVEVQKEPIIVYMIGRSEFNKYLESSYGIISTRTSLSSQVKLTPTNILGEEWQRQYGSSYSTASIAASSEFSFSQDFNCLAPSELVTGTGVIKRIYRKQIVISLNNGNQSILNLGTCSRLQSTSNLPSLGQTIYFKATTKMDNQFNVYRATCI